MNRLKNEHKEIIRALVENPRASYNEIADATGIPKSTVWYTKKRLEEDDLLRTVVFLQIDEVDGFKVGLVGGTVNGEKDAVLDDVANHPNVWFLVDTIGPHAFTAGVVGQTAEDFQRAIDELRELGAEGDHYGEVLSVREFGLSSEFIEEIDIE